jgi:hypothetical protein
VHGVAERPAANLGLPENLRPGAGGFFGKILKLDLIAMSFAPARFPDFRHSASRAGLRLPTGPAVVGCVAAAVLSTALATPPAASVYRRHGPPAVTESGPRSEEELQAERIVAGALLALDRADPFVGKVRQKVRIGDRVLTGPGRYMQAGTGEAQRYRFESRLECDTESFELLEVCDGLFAWRYRRNAADPPGLSRVDVRRVREKLVDLEAPEADSAVRYLGGLQRTLWTIREWFRFASAEAVDLDGLSAWRVEGRWDVDKLAAILPHLADAARRPGGIQPEELPDGVPWSVRLWIGRGDLLPRRIEWLAIPGERPVAAAEPEPIAVLDIHDIEVGGRVDATAFFYKPATAGLMDVTEQQVKTMRAWRP